MKKITTSLLVIMLALTIPQGANAFFRPALTNNTGKIDAAEAKRLTDRLEQIRAMDTKNLPRNERRALRKEVKETQKKLNANGGIYMSIGAVVLVLLLLILLL